MGDSKGGSELMVEPTRSRPRRSMSVAVLTHAVVGKGDWGKRTRLIKTFCLNETRPLFLLLFLLGWAGRPRMGMRQPYPGDKSRRCEAKGIATRCGGDDRARARIDTRFSR